MAQSNLPQSILAGTAPKKMRMLIAKGLAPIPPDEMLPLLVCLIKDTDSEVSTQALQTIAAWDEEEIRTQLKSPNCNSSVLEYFASAEKSDTALQTIISNPASPDSAIRSIAATAPAHLLEAILDNRVRIIKSPDILESIKKNPLSSPQIMRLVREIETEFLGDKEKGYEVEEPAETEISQASSVELEFDIPPEDLSLEGLPIDSDARESEIIKRLATLPMREKIRYALFGNREIRSVLIRDTNREVARTVLRSPKLTDNEIEAIAAMRSVGEDILREIGNSKSWVKSYTVVQNLIKNPKTPPVVAQRLLFRLRLQDLTLLTRDRSVSDAVRYSASRALRQRAAHNSAR
ncbi:MAG: hypothetical protein JXA73_02810 [Acidobacteria bacterium]|nr:hypothetical protein [Acidobacteriota bacterium]